MTEPRTEAGKRLLADKRHHGMGCMAFALKGSVLVDGKAVSGPLPDPCECGLSDGILAIERDTLDSLTAERDELRPVLEDIERCLAVANARWTTAHEVRPGEYRYDGLDGPLHEAIKSTVARLHDLNRRAALSEGGSK